jgi:NADPH:quinone reductase-like Zn-dependent oxidoreductase
MTAMPTKLPNTAAWLPAKKTRLEVGPAPYPRPGAGEIVVRNRAVAVNPIDWIIQLIGAVVFPWIKYPFVLGSDLAGDVVQVGAGVTRFRVGDRVLGHAVGTDKKRNSSAEGSFQDHTVVLAHLAAPIPAELSYEQAAVLPLALSTAGCGLFQSDHLALAHPRVDATPTGRTVLIWGGSTSVGANAIQLAVAAGYEVITTASPKNFDYVRGLGAGHVFDYRSVSVVDDIIAAFAGRTSAGALAIGDGSARQCVKIVRAVGGNKFISTATAGSFDGLPDRPKFLTQVAPRLLRILLSGIRVGHQMRSNRIRSKAIFGSTLMDNEVGPAIYVDFLPDALAQGRYTAAPPARVVGHGLAQLQHAVDLQKKGLSAEKIVVSL